MLPFCLREHLEESLRLVFLRIICEGGELEFVGPPHFAPHIFGEGSSLALYPTELELNLNLKCKNSEVRNLNKKKTVSGPKSHFKDLHQMVKTNHLHPKKSYITLH